MTQSLTPRIDDIQPNIIINGAFDYWQRVVGNTVNLTGTLQVRNADRVLSGVAGSTSKAYSVVRSTDVPTFAQAGFPAPYSLLATVTTPCATFSDPADYAIIFDSRLEGYDYALVHGQVCTFGFWFKASVAGLYSFAVNSVSFTRNYTSSFNVPVGSVWQYVTITLQFETPVAGYDFVNGVGFEFAIASVGGSTWVTPNLNTWQSSPRYQAFGAVNWMATNGATVQIAMLSLTKGPFGLPQGFFHRRANSINEELLLCQRYYRKSYEIGVAPGVAAGQGLDIFTESTAQVGGFNWDLPMRAAPALLCFGPDGAAGGVYRVQAGGASNTGWTGFQGVHSRGWTSIVGGSGLNSPGSVNLHYTAEAEL